MAHEVYCVLGHMSRRGARHPRKWNQAGDYAINLILEEADFEIGELAAQRSLQRHVCRRFTRTYLILTMRDGNDPLDEIVEAARSQGEDIGTLEWKIAAIQAANEAKRTAHCPRSATLYQASHRDQSRLESRIARVHD